MHSELWLGLILLALVATLFFKRNIFGRRRGKFRRPFYPPPSYTNPRPSSLGDASDQLRIVMGASFHKKKIMSKSEYAVFRTIEEHLLRSICGSSIVVIAFCHKPAWARLSDRTTTLRFAQSTASASIS